MPVVGREAELEALARELALVSEGAPGLVLLSGEAGIGKSELVRAFADGVRARARLVRYSVQVCIGLSGMPYACGRSDAGVRLGVDLAQEARAVARSTAPRHTWSTHMHPRDKLARMKAPELLSFRHTLVRSLGRARVNDPMCDAEDHAQATLVNLLGRTAEREQLHSLAHFAIGMGKRIRLMTWARRDRRQRFDPAIAQHLAMQHEPAEAPYASIDRGRMQSALARVLGQLDYRQRWLVEQRFVEEKPFAAILPEWQRRFGDRITTVEGLRTTLFKTKQQLQRALVGTGGETRGLFEAEQPG